MNTYRLKEKMIQAASVRFTGCDSMGETRQVEKDIIAALDLYNAGLITDNEAINKARTGGY